MGIQGAEAEFVVDQLVQCEGKAPGDDLFGQHNWQQAIVVLGFVTGHACNLLHRIHCKRRVKGTFYRLNV